MRTDDIASLGALAGQLFARVEDLDRQATEVIAAKDAEIEKLKAEIEELKGASK